MPVRAKRSFFFGLFPKMDYQMIGVKDDEKRVTNILTSFHLKKLPSTKSLIFQFYSLKDSDIPESVAEVLYGNYQHYWTILVVNDIVDPYSEWIMDNETLEAFTAKKYENGVIIKKADGSEDTLLLSEGINGIHHFINVQTEEIIDDYNDGEYRILYDADPDSIGENIAPVTNLAYEESVNMSHRERQVVAPRLMNNFRRDYENMIRGNL